MSDLGDGTICSSQDQDDRVCVFMMLGYFDCSWAIHAVDLSGGKHIEGYSKSDPSSAHSVSSEKYSPTGFTAQQLVAQEFSKDNKYRERLVLGRTDCAISHVRHILREHEIAKNVKDC
ncbi:hypothetical protein LIER_26896 [Lithospermum erythrorhizon]|uniref:Uncharacterized protein n=1 Tax=Lithospermum erythrorhizon TaxID=34254 RepID=A0AAV3RA15_LITER